MTKDALRHYRVKDVIHMEVETLWEIFINN